MIIRAQGLSGEELDQLTCSDARVRRQNSKKRFRPQGRLPLARYQLAVTQVHVATQPRPAA